MLPDMQVGSYHMSQAIFFCRVKSCHLLKFVQIARHPITWSSLYLINIGV